MLSDLLKAVAQLGDPATRRWVWLGVAVALLVIVLLASGVQMALALFADTGWPWVNWIVHALGGLGALLLAWFLFPAMITAVLGLVGDRIIEAVEARHYPSLGPGRLVGLTESVPAALRLAVLAVVANLVALPLYLVPGLNLVVVLLLNGYLIGREYFEMVAVRWMPAAEARSVRRRHAGEVLAAGLLVAAILLIPFVNLVAPIVGMALMTHRFHRLVARRSAPAATV
jgi:uncharacterized protein involved in cysteine biosynthesis